MKFVIFCNDDDWQHLQAIAINCTLVRAFNLIDFVADNSADAYFNLIQPKTKQLYNNIAAPIFVNDVLHTLAENNYPNNVIRLQCWPGFLQKNIWEIAGKLSTAAENTLQVLQKKYILVADTVGFVTTNSIAMIINEAYFALGQNVSTKEDIDTAMKLGTNYPYGPFEWAQKIGLNNVIQLLQKLTLQNSTYTPAPLLLQNSI